jgi:Holliday junction DNA helicase RuvA
MIGYITGIVLYSDSVKTILLTTVGIGYEIHTSTPKVPNKEASFFISHIIREASQDLYGFDTAEEKKFFELLLNVNGIGPKSAFSLISHVGVQQIISAVMFENVDIIKSAPGVGKKSAEQIILTLKDKVSKLEVGLSGEPSVNKSSELKLGKINKEEANLIKETLAACQGLGYKDQDVLPLIQKLIKTEAVLRPEELLKSILKEMR